MSRLIIKCTDEFGNEVDFQTSEKEGKELIAAYTHYTKWLDDNGFTPIEHDKSPPVKAVPKREKKVWDIDGMTCPKCSKRAWDNRDKIQTGEFSAKSPHFACSDNKGCKWVVWKDQYNLTAGGGEL